MKRWIVIIAVSVLLGKLFVGLLENLGASGGHLHELEWDHEEDRSGIARIEHPTKPQNPDNDKQAPHTPPVLPAENVATNGQSEIAKGPIESRDSSRDDEKEKKKKKKKKKKQDDDTGTQKGPPQEIADNLDAKLKSIDDSSNGNTVPGGALLPLPPTIPLANNILLPKTSVDNWIDLLTNHPSLDNLKSLVNAFQSGQLSSDDFYKVLREMIKSPNPLVRHLAVIGAATRQHSDSFAILADESITESDSTTRTAAIQGLQKYRGMQFLDVLSMQIGLGDTNGKIRAAEILFLVAENFSSQQRGPSNNANAGLFRPFVSLLDPITRDKTAPQELKAQVLRALGKINEVLAASTTAAI